MDKLFTTLVIIGITIAVILFSVGLYYLGTYPFAKIHYSDGERVGKVIKFSKKGVFVKNWCGQLALEGMINDGEGGVMPYVLDFGVERGTERGNEIAEQMKGLLNEKVKIKYDQRLVGNPFIGCNSYLIVEVEEIE